MNEQLDCLKHLYRMGFNLIPTNDKTPLVSFIEWTDRRIDPDTTCGWGHKFKECNWAVLAGAKPYNDTPGIVCVDCDDQAGYDLVKKSCPRTPVMQRTPGGGIHLIYRRPQVDKLTIRCKTRIKGILYNVDIRADHGYFLAPGSFSAKRGKSYEWSEPWTRELLERAPVYDPLWLPHEASHNRREVTEYVEHDEAIGMIQTPMPQRRLMAGRYIAKCPGSEQGCGADNYCYALAMCLLWGFGLDAESAHSLLYEWGQKCGNVDSSGWWYPWTDAEIRHKIRSALHDVYSGVVGDRVECVMNAFYAQLDELMETR